MTVSLLRGSSLPLLTKCPGSAYLPQERIESEELKKANEWGTALHKWKETGEVRSGSGRVDTAIRKAIELSGIVRDDFWPDAGTHEQSVAVRVDGSREVSRVHPSPANGWITGTADFVWRLLGDELWIDDLKTGKYYPDPETGENRYPQDVRSAQLKFYSLGAALLAGYRGTTHVSLTHWPRLPLARRHSKPDRFWTHYSWEELEAFYTELEAMYQTIQRGHGGDHSSLNPGTSHCRFCPSRGFCLSAAPIPQPTNPFNRR